MEKPKYKHVVYGAFVITKLTQLDDTSREKVFTTKAGMGAYQSGKDVFDQPWMKEVAVNRVSYDQ